jgi:hypothetical protein
MNKIPALLIALLASASISSVQAQVRAEVGKPLQQASQLLKAGKAKEALAKTQEADRAAGKTASEQLLIDRMKAAAAQRAGDLRMATDALESLYGRVPAGEKGDIAEQLAATYAQARNNGKAGEWLAKAQAAGRNTPTMKQLQSYLQSASGDYNAIAKEAGAAVAAAEQAGRRPDEGDLLRLADAQQRLGATSSYVVTLEKLLFSYPKKDYWTAYLGRLPRKAGFADRYLVDVLRLRLASGVLTDTNDYMELAQLALQAGLPAEGMRVIEQGFKSGALGTGAEASRHQRLKALAEKQLATAKSGMADQTAQAQSEKSGDFALKVGYAMVSLGDGKDGLALMQQGLAKGGLKNPDEGSLRMGMALLQLGQREQAFKVLRGVKGKDGSAEIARLWTLVSR